MNYENLVLSGGGVKGYTYIGIIKALTEKGILKNIKKINSCSAGSFFGLLICLNYSYEEIYRILININLENKLNFYNNKIDIITMFIENYGLDDGKELIRVVEIFIKTKFKKTNITFKELYEYSKINFIVTTTNLTKNKTEYFNHILTPNVDISLILRMSISIPFIFTPVSYNNYMYVDGGLTNNFPIDYFNDEIEKTIGISLSYLYDNNLDSLDEYIYSIINCIYNCIDIQKIKRYRNNVILLNNNCKSINFNISIEKKKELIREGYLKVIKFLKRNEDLEKKKQEEKLTQEEEKSTQEIEIKQEDSNQKDIKNSE
jgi:NTE family protein